MWSDNETSRDYLNFEHVADLVAERISLAGGEPLSIGVSGSWGVGKSSMMKLVKSSLLTREGGAEFRFVEFNAWLYQGYDDTRAALMEAIAQSLVEHAHANPGRFANVLNKVCDLAKRVRWFRLTGMLAGAGAAYYAGIPLPGLAGSATAAATGLFDGSVTPEDVAEAGKVAKEVKEKGEGLLKDESKPEKTGGTGTTPRKEIQLFRDELESSLSDMDLTLVVLIDDLDRCLPNTAIATLEAMRLFLFLKRTAFVIAADEKMIRRSVRAHFADASLDDDLVTNYFDKLIQLPISVPPLGTQDVRAYLMQLFIDASDLGVEEKDRMRKVVCGRLGETWTGKRLDKDFVLGELPSASAQLRTRIELADRIAPILTSSPKISGNPRLIKRFLNTLMLRASLAARQGVDVDEAVMIKLLLFERSGDRDAYEELLRDINSSEEGRPESLAAPEATVRAEDGLAKLEAPWDDPFLRDWLSLDPPLAGLDLRGAVYASRENYAIILRAEELGQEARELLDALLQPMASPMPALTARLKKLNQREMSGIMDRILAKARQETEWGTPPILNAAVTVADVGPVWASRLADFLATRPASQLQPALAARISTKPFAKQVFEAWLELPDLSPPVRKAIEKADR